jgi:hypothetical protein
MMNLDKFNSSEPQRQRRGAGGNYAGPAHTVTALSRLQMGRASGSGKTTLLGVCLSDCQVRNGTALL